jgi:hypothetical protein
VESEAYTRAEEALRLLAAAVGTARLYPPASALPREAAERFAERANKTMSATGPLRYIVDPKEFRHGDSVIASGHSQLTALAEALHAMQVGQLIFAPGITLAETAAFTMLMNSDPQAVRQSSGPRAALIKSGVTHIAVIELSLRASNDKGLAGIDLATAPLDVIAERVALAVDARAAEAAVIATDDAMATAINGLETATRELALERVAAALMRMDEETRMRVFASSLMADAAGTRMEGMLDAIARMKPAALSRLLRMTAMRAGTTPARLTSAMRLPPETAKVISTILGPTPKLDADTGISTQRQAAAIAEQLREADDGSDLRRQIASSSPDKAVGRALSTAVAVSRSRLDEDTVRGIGDVLPTAAREGAFTAVREALRRLDEIATDPGLTDAVNVARSTLADPSVLADVCRVPTTDADAAIAGEILQAAGPVGAEALLRSYSQGSSVTRSLLRPVLRTSSEAVLGAARAGLRDAGPKRTISIVSTLAACGDKRAVPLLAQVLDANLDETVRFAAASALAGFRTPEATQALIRAIHHREPETQRFVVRELGRIKAAAAVTQLSRAFDDINVLTRTYETRKEIITALASIGTPESVKVLRRIAGRPTVFGRRNKELKSQARRAVEKLLPKQGVDAS